MPGSSASSSALATTLPRRRRRCPARVSELFQDWPNGVAPLREPCLSSEYAESGLGELVPKRPFKQSFIPTFCDDIIPHKYARKPKSLQKLLKSCLKAACSEVLPLSEKEFLDRLLA